MKTAFVILLTLLAAGCLMVDQRLVGSKADIIDHVLADSNLFARVEINVWDHAGNKEEGRLTHLGADGTITTRWKSYYPILTPNKIVVEKYRKKLDRNHVLDIVRMFKNDSVLRLPAIDPKLVEPADQRLKTKRYSASLVVLGRTIHEFEVPDFDPSASNLPPAKILVSTVLNSADDLLNKAIEEDKAFLTPEKIADFLDEDEEENLWIELYDIHVFNGGRIVRLSDRGSVAWTAVRRPVGNEPGFQIERGTKRIDPNVAYDVFRLFLDEKILDVKEQREFGIPDEAIPIITITAKVGTTEHSRSVGLWAGEARKTVPFQRIRELMTILASDLK